MTHFKDFQLQGNLKLQNESFRLKVRRDGTFYAYFPGPSFPSVSVTGRFCAMNCKQCGRHYLKGMISCPTPDELYRKCMEFDKKGYKGLLVSGGYNEGGWVPLEGFVSVLARIKRETNLVVNVHCGLAPEELAQSLGQAGVDVVSFDLIGHDETIKEVIGLDKTVDDYERTLNCLIENVSSVVPHITIGLHEGRLLGEERAIEIASTRKISALVFLVLVPTAGTAFENVKPPLPEQVEALISSARLKMPNIPIILGCMRPRLTDFEAAALASGVDGIVLPKKETLETAKKMGLSVLSVNACCAVPIGNGG